MRTFIFVNVEELKEIQREIKKIEGKIKKL